MHITSKIKQLRALKGMTLEKLAELTGFTKGYLSKVERSPKTPPFATVQLIAEALGVDIIELLDIPPDVSFSKNIEIVKHSDTSEQGWEETSLIYSFKPLVNHYKNKYMAPFLFSVNKGTTDTTTHDSEEFVYVLEGSLQLNYEGKVYALAKGDSFYLDARIKHSFTNTDDTAALLVAVHFNYRRF